MSYRLNRSVAKGIVIPVLLAIAAMAHPQERRLIIKPELIVSETGLSDGINAWGGHQCRIVRTRDGLFTAYTSGEEDILQKKWFLYKQADNGWKQVASGKSGREPVNLMASPDGTLHIIAYPGLVGTHFTGKPDGDHITFEKRLIPAVKEGTHPYNSASIDAAGNIVALSSEGGHMDQPGEFRWAYYDAAKNRWRGRVTLFDYRYCYTFIFPDPDKSVTIVSTRDVTWRSLGYVKPETPGTHNYSFNAIGIWHAMDFDSPLERVVNRVVEPTESFPDAHCSAQDDVYMDESGFIHVLSTQKGAITGGIEKNIHCIYTIDGKLLRELEIPDRIGRRCRIFQDERKRFFNIGSRG